MLPRRVALSLLALLLGVCSVPPAEARPNVILVYMDDMGWGDLATQGAVGFETPHLDRLAEEGTRFTRFYSVCSVCSASRAGLMTGCYPARVINQSVLFPDSKSALHPDELIVPEVLAAGGYQSHMIGKWHLGHQPAVLPTEQGFQTYFGVPYSNDMGCDPTMTLAKNATLRANVTRENFASISTRRTPLAPLMRDREIVEVPSDQTTLTKRYTQRAVKLIRDHGSKNGEAPLFLYYAHTMPHKPIAASEDFVGQTERGLYGDVIAEIDWSIGQLTSAIRDSGLADNTLLIFSSDNGPWNDNSSAHLRGKKFTNFEGGQRVPTIVWGPNTIPAGQVSDGLGSTIDILPTLCSLCDVEMIARNNAKPDGIDQSPYWLGKTATSPRSEFFYYGPSSQPKPQGVRDLRWKLLITARKRRNDKGPQEQFPCLYDLDADESETTNVATDHPDVVARLTARIDEFESQIKANQRQPWMLPVE